MQRTLASILRAVDTLIANQMRQGQAQQEAESDLNESNDGQTTNLVAQEAGSSMGSQLLKDFMVFQPSEFNGGVDILVAEN